MKLTFNVDCTPEEARAFLGLPDVRPMQQALIAELEQRLRENIASMSPEAMVKTWMPAGMAHVEQAQKLFWSNLQQTMTGLAATTTGAMSAFAERANQK
jgi:hypothetical protein